MEIGFVLVDDAFLTTAAQLVAEAKKSICISTFKAEITPKPRGRRLSNFFELVFEKARQGISVRFIINKTSMRGAIPLSNALAINALYLHGIPVHCLPNNRCCHAKILIVDNDSAIIGSHNLSVKSCNYNFELSYLIKDTYVVNIIQKTFDRTWDQGTPPYPPLRKEA